MTQQTEAEDKLFEKWVTLCEISVSEHLNIKEEFNKFKEIFKDEFKDPKDKVIALDDFWLNNPFIPSKAEIGFYEEIRAKYIGGDK